MINFSKCKTTKDYEQVLLASIKIFHLGKERLSATGIPIPFLAKMLRQFKHRYTAGFSEFETKSGHLENCLFPNDEVEVENCANCEEENEVPFRAGCYVSFCEHCGEKMHLCSRCLHDDPNGRCDWDSDTGTCRRG